MGQELPPGVLPSDLHRTDTVIDLPEPTTTEHIHEPYITKVVEALNAAGIPTPDCEVEDNDPRNAFIQLGAADPDTGREIYLCWTEESGWYRGVDQNGSGVLSLIRWADLGVLPDPHQVVTWVRDQEGSAPAPGQFERPRYRSFDDDDGFDADLTDAGATAVTR